MRRSLQRGLTEDATIAAAKKSNISNTRTKSPSSLHTLNSRNMCWVRQVPFNYNLYVVQKGEYDRGEDIVCDTAPKQDGRIWTVIC